MTFLYVKAAHVIFVITWFAAIFYLGRLLVYTEESRHRKDDPKKLINSQLLLMTRRLLFAIGWPSVVLTWILGLTLVYYYPMLPSWLIIKIVLVFVLTLYFLSLHYIHLEQAKGKYTWTSFQLRMWNEVPTVFLVAIVTLVIVKSGLSPIWSILGLIGFSAILLLSIRIYKYFRRNT